MTGHAGPSVSPHHGASAGLSCGDPSHSYRDQGEDQRPVDQFS